MYNNIIPQPKPTFWSPISEQYNHVTVKKKSEPQIGIFNKHDM